MDYDELDWLLTAVQESGLYWLATHGEITRCYLDAHVRVAPEDGIGHAAYDSLVVEGHQEFTSVWWTLPGGRPPLRIGRICSPPARGYLSRNPDRRHPCSTSTSTATFATASPTSG